MSWYTVHAYLIFFLRILQSWFNRNTPYAKDTRCIQNEGGIPHCRNSSKYNWTITKTGKIETLNIYTWPLTFLTWYRHFNKKWRAKLVLRAGASPLLEMMRSRKCFPMRVTCQPSQHTTGCQSSVVLKNARILNFIYNIFNLRDMTQKLSSYV